MFPATYEFARRKWDCGISTERHRHMFFTFSHVLLSTACSVWDRITQSFCSKESSPSHRIAEPLHFFHILRWVLKKVVSHNFFSIQSINVHLLIERWHEWVLCITSFLCLWPVANTTTHISPSSAVLLSRQRINALPATIILPRSPLIVVVCYFSFKPISTREHDKNSALY